jgi:hypothetical protein
VICFAEGKDGKDVLRQAKLERVSNFEEYAVVAGFRFYIAGSDA